MQPVGFAELRDAGITRTGYELHGLLLILEAIWCVLGQVQVNVQVLIDLISPQFSWVQSL